MSTIYTSVKTSPAVYRDFDWELDRFVEYRLPIKKPL